MLKIYAVFFNFFFYFFEWLCNFILASTAIVLSELAGATKSGIEQQISNQKKRALNFYATFIRLC